MLEQYAKPPALGRVNRLHESHPAVQVRPKLRMSIAILALGTETNAVGQGGLEAIEVGPYDVHPLIGDQARQMLPHAMPHDARLAVMDGESFFVQNRGDMRGEALHAALE